MFLGGGVGGRREGGGLVYVCVYCASVSRACSPRNRQTFPRTHNLKRFKKENGTLERIVSKMGDGFVSSPNRNLFCGVTIAAWQ